MSFDPQDCEEMPILASDYIEKLEVENKALKEVEKILEEIGLDLTERLMKAEKNRDELLDFLKRVDRENWLDGDWWADIIPLIEKTEALKKRESK